MEFANIIFTLKIFKFETNRLKIRQVFKVMNLLLHEQVEIKYKKKFLDII